MPNFKDAMSNRANHVSARLINKRIFTHRRKPGERSLCLIELHMVDGDGTEFALKSWSPGKAYYCWFNMKVGAYYIASNVLSDRIAKADFTYSSVRFDVLGPWSLQPCSPKITHNYTVRTVTNYDKATKIIARRDRSVNMLAKFDSVRKSTAAVWSKKGCIVQGYEVHLLDDSNVKFSVLVWHSPKFQGDVNPLFNFKPGEGVLINAARLNNNKKGSNIDMTSLFPPVNRVSSFVAPSQIERL